MPTASRPARDLSILLLAGALALGGMWLLGGVRLSPDSYRYLEAAYRLNQGLPLSGMHQLCPGFTHPLAWLLAHGLGLSTVVLVQCLLSLAAAALAYLALAPLWGRRAALIGGLLYLLLPNLQRWNLYLLTDGAADSLLVVLLAAVVMLPRRPWALLLALAAGAWLGLLRSEGLIYLLPPILFLAWRRRWWAALALTGLLAALALGQDLGAASQAQNLLGQARQGTVIWDMWNWPPCRRAARPNSISKPWATPPAGSLRWWACASSGCSSTPIPPTIPCGTP